MGAGTRTILGMTLGALVGWLAGDAIRVLEPLAAACLLLMQMPVIPYLVLSLIDGLGRLSPETLRKLAGAGGVAIVAVWVIALATVFVLGGAFPQGAGAYFTDAAAKDADTPSIVALLIPNNPFDALSRAVVPGIVFFCLFFVAELVNVPKREVFLDAIGAATRAVERVTSRINKMAPYTVFILMAVAVGTFGPEFFHRMEIFTAVFAAGAVVLGLWLIPMVVAMTTPVPFGKLLSRTFGALSLAFTTGSNLVALPLIIQACKELTQETEVEKEASTMEQDDAMVETVVPVLANIPNAGHLLVILMVPFTAASYGSSVAGSGYAQVATAGVLSLFGPVGGALRYMLEICDLPTDVVSLYTTAQSILVRLAALGKVSSITALTLLITFAVRGKLRVRPLHVVALLAGTLVPLALGAQLLSGWLPGPEPQVAWERMTLRSMVGTTYAQAASVKGEVVGGVVRIRRDGVLRVGYFENSLPYTYRNAQGNLVGYHAALAQQMASDLEGNLLMVACTHDGFLGDLEAGRIDTLAAPIHYTAAQVMRTALTGPYLVVRSMLTVRDSSRRAVEAKVASGRTQGLRVGVLQGGELVGQLERMLPGAVPVPLRTLASVDGVTDVDAILWHDVDALAWATTHAGYSAVALPNPATHVLCFATRRDDDQLRDALQSWIDLRRGDGTLDLIFRQWIMGKAGNGASPQPPALLELLHLMER